MLAIPLRIYNTSVPKKKQSRIKKLEEEVERYKTANRKLKILAEWNLRATQSALKNSQEMIEIIETFK